MRWGPLGGWAAVQGQAGDDLPMHGQARQPKRARWEREDAGQEADLASQEIGVERRA
jgi:hypothetical protein